MTAETVGAAAARGRGSGMWKYYALLFAALVLVLAYVYVADPCNRLLRTDFARMKPGHLLLDARAEMGSPESVRCRITYREPGSGSVFEDVWMYQYAGTAWQFSRIADTRQRELTGTE